MGVVEGGRGVRRSGCVWAVTTKSLFVSRGSNHSAASCVVLCCVVWCYVVLCCVVL
jgi:hypothetical protein